MRTLLKQHVENLTKKRKLDIIKKKKTSDEIGSVSNGVKNQRLMKNTSTFATHTLIIQEKEKTSKD